MQKDLFKKIIYDLMLVFGFATRFLPHPPNFTSIGALFIFHGIYGKKNVSIFLPLTVMLVSDLFIGFYDYKIMASVYIGFILMYLVGVFVRGRKNIFTLTFSSLFGSTLFFIITNFAVWYFSNWYPKDLQGFLLAYTLALPFFKSAVLGDLIYTMIFIGGYELILNRNKIHEILINFFKYGYKAPNQAN